MSHSGIGLQFTTGPGAQPHQLVIRDTEAWCPGCGLELQVRHYTDLPFHSLTTARLTAELAEPPAFDEQCRQCEHDVTEADAAVWSLHVGFGGGSGVISGFCSPEGVAGWAMRPTRSLSVQQLPAFRLSDLDPETPVTLTLDEDEIVRVCGRYWNLKSAVRRWVLRHGPPEPGQVRRIELAPGTVAFDVAADTPREMIAQKAVDPISGTPWELAPLCTADGLADGFHGAPADWLTGLGDALDGRDLWCAADPTGVFDVVDAVCNDLPIATRVRMDADGTLWLRISGRKDREGAPEIDPRTVARHAARTCSALGDVARMELDHVVIGLVLSDTPDAAQQPAAPVNILQHPSMDAADIGSTPPWTARDDAPHD